MKKPTIVTVIAVCLILCAAVWSKPVPAKEISATLPPPAVTTTQHRTPKSLEIEDLTTAEE